MNRILRFLRNPAQKFVNWAWWILFAWMTYDILFR
jgi:hypothetical protein